MTFTTMQTRGVWLKTSPYVNLQDYSLSVSSMSGGASEHQPHAGKPDSLRGRKKEPRLRN